MDGGRILRAALSGRMGYLRATELSVTIARGFAIALGLYGLFSGQFYLALLAVMLWFMSAAERAAARYFGARYSDQPEVEVLPRGAPQPGRDAVKNFWSGGFVVRRQGNRIIIEPAE